MGPSGIGVTPGGVRDALRAQRFLVLELLVAAAILAAGFAAILPFSATPFLVVFGVVSLWLRGQGPRAVGLAFRSDWVRTVSVGIGAGIVYQGFSLYIAEPASARTSACLLHWRATSTFCSSRSLSRGRSPPSARNSCIAATC